MATITPDEVKHDLRSASGHAFEGVCYSYLRPFIPGLVHAKSMGKTDRDGADLFTRIPDDQPGDLDLAIQCKGFEKDFGDSQRKQCLDTIAKFKASGRTTRIYKLVLNCIVTDAGHRHQLQSALDDLVRANVAVEAELLSYEKLCLWLGELARNWVGSALKRRWRHLRDEYAERMEARFYLPDVPCHRDDGARVKGGPIQDLLNDAGRIDLSRKATPPGRIFVVGEFGFGKTSLMLKVFEGMDGLVQFPIYAPVTQFRSDAFANEKAFVSSILETVLNDEDWSPNQNMHRLLREALVNILRGEDRAALLLDGLDEHPFMYRGDGMDTLFNCLRQFQSLVVMTVRTEFWRERSGNIQIAIENARGCNRNIRTLHLDDWEQMQMDAFVENCLKYEHFHSEGFSRFAQIINSGRYQEYFGDIPRRPLFLHMLAEDAADGGIDGNNLATLYYNYFRKKLARDQFQLDRSKDSGRPQFFPDSDIASRTAMVIDALTEIASGTFRFDITIEGTSTTSELLIIYYDFTERNIQSALSAKGHDKKLATILINSSLLLPTSTRGHGEATFRFSHRSYHEWFIARILRSHPPSETCNLKTSPVLLRFIDQMRAAGTEIP